MNIKKRTDIIICTLTYQDIESIVTHFQANEWPKPASLFEGYLHEQIQNERTVWIAYLDKKPVGYVTLKWLSEYEPFKIQKIPEINDLNVLPSFRKMGIGSQLLERAEQQAATQSETIGIGVGLYGGPDGGYGPAQILYIKSGYLPNGLGISYQDKILEYGQSAILDDDLVLWFTKKLIP